MLVAPASPQLGAAPQHDPLFAQVRKANSSLKVSSGASSCSVCPQPSPLWRPARKLSQGGHQSRLQAIQDRLRRGLPDGTPLGGTAPPDPRLDRINLAQAGDDVARERGMGRLIDGDKLATGMGQTKRELDLRMAAGQPLVAAVPVYLENACEALNLGGEIRHRASLGIDVSDRRRGRTAPRAIINGVAPELTAFGAPASRIEDRHRGLIGEHA